MEKAEADIGLIGLGVMGRNLAYNIADHSFSVAGYDRSKDQVHALKHDADNDRVHGVDSVEDLLAQLKKPRAVILLVPAGKPVDAVIGELQDRLDPGDIIIDGGNSHFTDTNRHTQDLAAKQIQFLGIGVSGGSDGARYGPSMMPGGPKDAYERVRPIFEAIAAHVDDVPCVTYLGPGSAGHYVKMVHNGIEYALMELIAEVYDVLKRVGRLSNDELADTFGTWNKGPMASFLLEITSGIFKFRDSETRQRLIDMVLDSAHQKGTGKWTSQDAMELQVPVPTIDAAVSMRDMSGYKAEREEAAKAFPPPDVDNPLNRDQLIDAAGAALRFSMIVSYAQGLSQLRAASEKYQYDLHPGDIARIWRGGCIIRAAILDDIHRAFDAKPDLPNLMMAEPFAGILRENREPLVRVISVAGTNGIAAPGLASALAYFDAYRSFRLPANLIQAQRDCFGSHTYERVDRKGTFHSRWL